MILLCTYNSQVRINQHCKMADNNEPLYNNMERVTLKRTWARTNTQTWCLWYFRKKEAVITALNKQHAFYLWVLVCEWRVNEGRFAAWADGEHWSACWQVAYSLLSELTLSHTQWEPCTKPPHTYIYKHTHTAAALSLNWYPEGFDGERQIEEERYWYERGNEHQNRRPAGQLFTSEAVKERIYI